MKRPPVRKVRWRKRESSLFAALEFLEAVNPASLTERDRNELERLDRARRARWHARRSRGEKRHLRRRMKKDKSMMRIFDLVYQLHKHRNLDLTFTQHTFTVPTT